jgi:calmodulin|tara:strand:- start:2939 stop:3394 length:456 start_codon:yes stop_codon:yes gene_type:complete
MSFAEQNELKEAFNLFDRDGTGTIPIGDLGTVVRALGLNPTEAEVADLEVQVDPARKGYVQFADFLTMMAQRPIEADTEADIIDAFRAFDTTNGGGVHKAELKRILTRLGEENLTAAEFDGVFGDAPVDADGRFRYEDQVQSLCFGPFTKF